MCVSVGLFVPETQKVCAMPNKGSGMNMYVCSVYLIVMLVGVVSCTGNRLDLYSEFLDPRFQRGNPVAKFYCSSLADVKHWIGS